MQSDNEQISSTTMEMVDWAILESCPENFNDLQTRDKLFYEQAFREGMKYAVKHLQITLDIMGGRQR